MRVAIYLRVSTDGQSVDSQRDDLRNECLRRGFDPVEFSDLGVSGAKIDRPALDRMMAEVRAGRIRAVLCYKLDRLGRSLAHLVQLMDQMEAKDCALIVPGQGIDTSRDCPAAKLQRQILGAVCEFERSLIRDRVKAGMARAKAAGRLSKRKKRGMSKGMESKIRRAEVIFSQDPAITCEDLAREIGTSTSSAWKIRRQLENVAKKSPKK